MVLVTNEISVFVMQNISRMRVLENQQEGHGKMYSYIKLNKGIRLESRSLPRTEHA